MYCSIVVTLVRICCCGTSSSSFLKSSSIFWRITITVTASYEPISNRTWMRAIRRCIGATQNYRRKRDASPWLYTRDLPRAGGSATSLYETSACGIFRSMWRLLQHVHNAHVMTTAACSAQSSHQLLFNIEIKL